MLTPSKKLSEDYNLSLEEYFSDRRLTQKRGWSDNVIEIHGNQYISYNYYYTRAKMSNPPSKLKKAFLKHFLSIELED